MIIDELRALLSEEQLRAFLACYAGNDVRFRKRDDGASFAQLERVVGREAASRLRARFAGECVYIPREWAGQRERRNTEIVARIAAGDPPHQVARNYGISERAVRKIRAKHGLERPTGRPPKVAA